MTIEIEGVDEMQRTLKRIADSVPDQGEQALMAEAEVLVEQARERVPVDTGALKRSIRAEGPTRRGRDIEAKIVAGGPDVPYAALVHEDLDAQHPEGGAKFLEGPLFEGSGSLLRRLGNRFNLKKAAR